MSSPKKVLAFDIGIRNLAWCLMDRTETSWGIHGWNNYDLLAGESTQNAKNREKLACHQCGKKAKYQSGGKMTCVKHCPPGKPALHDLSGGLLTKIPTCKVLEKMLKPKQKSRAGYLHQLEESFSLPIVNAKATKAKTEDIASLHNSMQKFVDEHKTLFQSATHIFLENQPAYKNPTMKSVQILLFATLRERLFPATPFVGFIHAGNKVKGATGYADRKKGSETRIQQFLEKETIHEKEIWKKVLAENQKKSDLCDAMCMCIDRLNIA
jgi:hypothetical protein